MSTLSSDSAIDLAQNHSIATLIAGDAPGVRHRLAPSQAADFSVWLYGPAEPGLHSIGLLFYYDADPAHPSSNFRLMRHTICIDVQPGVNISVIAAAPVPMDLVTQAFHAPPCPFHVAQIKSHTHNAFTCLYSAASGKRRR
eukprot:SAG31_NODE_2145_length_6340_cov_2.456177_3_plen_141_part_00